MQIKGLIIDNVYRSIAVCASFSIMMLHNHKRDALKKSIYSDKSKQYFVFDRLEIFLSSEREILI